MTEDLEIVIIELPKLRKYGTEKKKSIYWLEFIQNPNSLGEDILENNKELKKAKEEYDKIVADENEKGLMRLREKYIKDQNTLIAENYEEGYGEGYHEGKDDAFIIRVTGINQEELDKIKAKK